MLVAIISDIHDNLVNLKKFLTWAKENHVKEIICCGDVTNNETLKFLAVGFSGKIHLVQGNIELYAPEKLEKYKNIINYNETGVAKINHKKIGICHEKHKTGKLLENDGLDYIFYGHSHEPWAEEIGKVKLVNPGTLGGVFQKASFAVWNSKTASLELKILELL